MAKKRKRGKPAPGGRYTAPTPKVAARNQPIVTSETFDDSMKRQDRDLRARCARLLGDSPPTNSEWVDADLAGMDGLDASDELLTAYWAAHRRAVEVDLFELPDLSDISRWLAEGSDPVAAVEALAGDDE